MEQLVAYDSEQEIRFTGEVIGSASSYSPSRPRWIEITIFRTAAGQYVLQGEGKTTVQGEEIRRWAHVSESPRGIIETLTMRDADGVNYLTNVAKDALRQASDADKRMHEAYMVRTID